MEDIAARFPVNPDYGTGYFVRTAAFRRISPTCIEAAMEDPFHALALRIEHDAAALTSVEARWERHPLSSCAGAGGALASLANMPLIDDLRSRWRDASAPLHCTHMFDTLRLAAVHIAHRRDDTRYDVVMPDATNPAQSIQLWRDGEVLLEIEVDAEFVITQPQSLAGEPLLAGFARWANQRLTAREFELFFIMQRGAFVGRGQRYDITRFYGREGALSGPPGESCYGSQPHRYEGSHRLPNARPGLRREDAARFGFAQSAAR